MTDDANDDGVEVDLEVVVELHASLEHAMQAAQASAAAIEEHYVRLMGELGRVKYFAGELRKALGLEELGP